MSESGRIAAAETLQDRLPTDWTVETSCGVNGPGEDTDSGRLCGYEDSAESVSREKASGRGAAFEIRPDGELWTATWLGRRGYSADRVGVHRVTGVKERCVGWVIERARGAEETDGE